MPSFKLLEGAGIEHSSENLYANLTLIDFWASWCKPCRADNPNLKMAYEQFKDKGFRIVSISIDQSKDKGRWLDAIKIDQTEHFLNLFDPADHPSISKTLKINAIPANYLVDKSGTIIATDLRGTDLQNKLRDLLK
jgi:thiol-disulfide isomerase/thioredoxin